MKKFNINIEEFLRKFDEEYEFLYDHRDNVAGYDEALAAGDEFISAHPEFVAEFVNYRGDFISSDREVVAFMFALDSLAGDGEEETAEAAEEVPPTARIAEEALRLLDVQHGYVRYAMKGGKAVPVNTMENQRQDAYYAGMKAMLEMILTNNYAGTGCIVRDRDGKHHFDAGTSVPFESLLCS